MVFQKLLKFDKLLVMAAKSRSAIFYKNHPEARAKKKAYDTRFNRKPSQVNKREELNRYNYNHKSGPNDDAYHKGKKIVGFKSASKNRGDKNDSVGDRKSRGSRMKFGRRKSR